MSPKVCSINILNWVYNLSTEIERVSNWNNPELCVFVSSNSSIWEAETEEKKKRLSEILGPPMQAS